MADVLGLEPGTGWDDRVIATAAEWLEEKRDAAKDSARWR